MKALIAIIVLIIIGFGAYFLFYNNPSTTSPAATSPNPVTTTPVVPTPTPVATPAPTSPAAHVAVSIKGFAFVPATITVKPGTTVTWTNNDTVAHTVTSDSGNLLDSPTISPGQSFSFTFTSAGSVSYHCTIHPNMKGKVIVQS